MAASKGVAHSTASRTTWPPTKREPLLLPPNHRKFPFESPAADPVAGAAVTEEHPLNQDDEGCAQELQDPGFDSPGARDRAGCRGWAGWAGNGEFSFSRLLPWAGTGQVALSGGYSTYLGLQSSQGNVHLASSRAQPCRLVTMTSVVKTVYTLQPPAVQSCSLQAGGYPRRPADRRGWSGRGVRGHRSVARKAGRVQGKGNSSALTICYLP